MQEAQLNLQQNKGDNVDLHTAIRKRRIADVKACLAAGSDPNIKDAQGATALIAAIDRQQKQIVELLLDAGADINLENRAGDTPLLRANDGGDTAIAKLLLDRGADVRRTDAKNAPLLQDTFLRNPELTSLLLSKGANMSVRDNYERIPLACALSCGHPAAISLLLEHTPDCDIRANAKHLLMLAIDHDPATARAILQRIGKYEPTDERDLAGVLQSAVGEGDPALVQLFIDYGWPVNNPNESGDTPLHTAAYFHNPVIVKILIMHGADVTAQNDRGLTPLSAALPDEFYHRHCDYEENKQVVQILLEHGASPNLPSDSPQNPMKLAIAFGKKDLVELLVAHGGDPKALDIFATTNDEDECDEDECDDEDECEEDESVTKCPFCGWSTMLGDSSACPHFLLLLNPEDESACIYDVSMDERAAFDSGGEFGVLVEALVLLVAVFDDERNKAQYLRPKRLRALYEQTVEEATVHHDMGEYLVGANNALTEYLHAVTKHVRTEQTASGEAVWYWANDAQQAASEMAKLIESDTKTLKKVASLGE